MGLDIPNIYHTPAKVGVWYVVLLIVVLGGGHSGLGWLHIMGAHPCVHLLGGFSHREGT
jgi:hypothetical protein